MIAPDLQQQYTPEYDIRSNCTFCTGGSVVGFVGRTAACDRPSLVYCRALLYLSSKQISADCCCCCCLCSSYRRRVVCWWIMDHGSSGMGCERQEVYRKITRCFMRHISYSTMSEWHAVAAVCESLRFTGRRWYILHLVHIIQQQHNSTAVGVNKLVIFGAFGKYFISHCCCSEL